MIDLKKSSCDFSHILIALAKANLIRLKSKLLSKKVPPGGDDSRRDKMPGVQKMLSTYGWAGT